MNTSIKQTPSLPDVRTGSDCFRCGGRESNFLAVRAADLLGAVLSLGVSAQAGIISVNQVESFGNPANLIGTTSAAESGELAGATEYKVGYWNESAESATLAGTLLDSNGSTVSGLSVTLGAGGNNSNWSLSPASPPEWPLGNDRNMMLSARVFYRVTQNP